MRLAIVSDIHGNLPALEAVLADLDHVRPDAVVLGGDLAFGGPNPVEVVDRLRALGWPSVLGNTDEALDDSRMPEAGRTGFMGGPAVRTREMLGPERVAWLTGLPLLWSGHGIAVMHSVPEDCWAVVTHDAPDEKLRGVYGSLGVATAVYGHIHHAFVRDIHLEGGLPPPGGPPGGAGSARTPLDLTVVNSGSVSLSLDGDVRACYAVVEDGRVELRRVEYDVERVAAEYIAMGYPNAETYAAWLRNGAFPND